MIADICINMSAFFVLGVGVFCIKLIMINAKGEELPAEEHAGFRPGRSTVEQICNSRIIMEKHLKQCDLFHKVIDFKKAFDRVWHAGLRQVVKNFSIDEGLVQTIQAQWE